MDQSEILKLLMGKSDGSPVIPFAIPKSSPLAEEHELLFDVLDEGSKYPDWRHDDRPFCCDSYDEILTLDANRLVRFVEAISEQLTHYEIQIEKLSFQERQNQKHEALFKKYKILRAALGPLLKRKLPLTDSSFHALFNWLGSRDSLAYAYYLPEIVRAVERFIRENPGETEVSSRSRGLLDQLRYEEKTSQTAASRRDIKRLIQHLESVFGKAIENPIKLGEVWSDYAIAELNKLQPNQQSAWIALLMHCASGTEGKPNAKWVSTAKKLLDTIGSDTLKAAVLRWFPLVDKPRPGNRGLVICESNMDILRGLAWCCSLREDKELARALCALGISAYKKLPGIGARAIRVGNACVWALGNMPGFDAVGQLAYMRVRVKFGTAQKGIEKALNAAAARANMPREDLEELSVSSYGLTEVGRCEEQFGDFTAELRVDGSDVELNWCRADGKTVASVPAAVKTGHAEELKELKGAKADLEKMLPAQKERLDALFLQRKTWPFAMWRERYLDHPLVGTLARRLIWRFKKDKTGEAGIFHDGKIVDNGGKALDVEETTVELWHPLDESADLVQSWRRWLEDHQVRQPFKQAHREIYVLTDAERNTRTYSNRFAAHIIRQHQFNALCAVRGWKNKLRLLVDDSYPPAQRLLPQWNLRVEYWVEGIGDNYGQDTNETGVFYYLSTDQVRFYPLDSQASAQHAYHGQYRAGDADPVPLERIPPLVFSEVMRDVDLFVGVCSVGNDPAWADGAREGPQQTYWRDYSFGALNETAKTRKQVLERLIPKLNIAARCSFDDKFLVVKGDIRTYKIHLGSGNIMMAPNDQYLCIVAKQSAHAPADGKVFLPFEGDHTLAVILSKAFLLAADAKIKDPSIVSQISK